MTDGVNGVGQPPDAVWGEYERVAAGEDDLANAGVELDVFERPLDGLRREARLSPRSDHLAPKAEPAVDRAGVHDCEEHPVWITMHETFDRGVLAVSYGISQVCR